MSTQEPTPGPSANPTAVRCCPSCGGQNTYRGIEQHPGPLSVCAHCGHEWEHPPDQPDAPTEGPGETAGQAREPREAWAEPTDEHHRIAREVWGLTTAADPEAFMDVPLPKVLRLSAQCAAVAEARHKPAPTPGPETTDRERRRKAAALWDSDEVRKAWTPAEAFEVGADYEALHCRGERERLQGEVSEMAALSVIADERAQKAENRLSLADPQQYAAECERLREALRVIRGVMGPTLGDDGWSIIMDPVGAIVAAIALNNLPEMPEDAWGESVREAHALLTQTEVPAAHSGPPRLEGREPYQDHVVIDGKRHQVYLCYNCNIETIHNPCVCGAFVRALYAEGEAEPDGTS